MNNRFIIHLLGPLIGGSLFALAFPGKQELPLFGLQILGFALLFLCVKSPLADRKTQLEQVKFNLIIALSFSLGYCLTGYYWIPSTLQQFGSIPTVPSHLLGVLFALIIMPQLTIYLVGRNFVHRYITIPKNIPRGIIAALSLTLLEYYTPQQFPAHMGHPWMHLAPHIGLAPIFGVTIFSFFGFWLAIEMSDMIKNKKVHWFPLVSFLIFLLINWLMPLKNIQDTNNENEKILKIRMVQANVGNFMKVDAEQGGEDSMMEIYRRYMNLSIENMTSPSDLIVWPETAFPEFINSERSKESHLYTPSLIREIIFQTGSEIFFGGYEKTRKHDNYDFMTQYNSAFLFSKQSLLKDVYHKTKLIPFGEGLPFGALNRHLSKIITNISYFAEGTEYPIFETENGGRFISLICYEVLFPELVRTYLKNQTRPHLIMNLTNDSWYGDSSEPHQHLFLSKWRSVEFNLPMIRMTNTGISTVVNTDGTEGPRLGVGQIGHLDIALKIHENQPTIFERLGIIPTLIAVILIVGISFLCKLFLKRDDVRRRQ